MYSAKKTATKGSSELVVMVISSIIATNLVPYAQQVGIDVDPTILAVAVVTAIGTLSRIIGNWWKHR